MYKSIVFVAALGLLIMACSKADTSDPQNINSEQLDRPYCNDPEAINYNYTFPGKPDNSICYYPTQVFRGTYLFIDTIYDSDNKVRRIESIAINLSATSNTELTLNGLCGSNNPLKITADRFFKATLDSTIIEKNGIIYNLNGQYLCTQSDTVSGYMIKNKIDTNKLTFSFSVASDSGYSYHRGTGILQR